MGGTAEGLPARPERKGLTGDGWSEDERGGSRDRTHSMFSYAITVLKMLTNVSIGLLFLCVFFIIICNILISFYS